MIFKFENSLFNHLICYLQKFNIIFNMKIWLCWGPPTECDLSIDNLSNLLFDGKLYHFRLLEETSNLITVVNNSEKKELPYKLSFNYLLSEEQYDEIINIVDDKRYEFMKSFSGKIYYLGLGFENMIPLDYNYNTENINPFFNNHINYEFIVRIKQMCNSVNYCQRLIELEIIQDFSNKFKSKDIIFVGKNNNAIPTNSLVGYNPEVFINNYNWISYNSDYCSLFIPIETYNDLFKDDKFLNSLSQEELLTEKNHIDNQINIISETLHSLNKKLFKIQTKLKNSD